jgi:hypothetical protein
MNLCHWKPLALADSWRQKTIARRYAFGKRREQRDSVVSELLCCARAPYKLKWSQIHGRSKLAHDKPEVLTSTLRSRPSENVQGKHSLCQVIFPSRKVDLDLLALQNLEFGIFLQTLDQKTLNMENLQSADLCNIWFPQWSHPKNTRDSQGVSRPNIWSQTFSMDFLAVQNRSVSTMLIYVSTIFSDFFSICFYHFHPTYPTVRWAMARTISRVSPRDSSVQRTCATARCRRRILVVRTADFALEMVLFVYIHYYFCLYKLYKSIDSWFLIPVMHFLNPTFVGKGMRAYIMYIY